MNIGLKSEKNVETKVLNLKFLETPPHPPGGYVEIICVVDKKHDFSSIFEKAYIFRFKGFPHLINPQNKFLEHWNCFVFHFVAFALTF